MPFGVVTGIGRGMGVLDGSGDRRRGRTVLGVNLGRTIVTNGAFATRSKGKEVSGVYCPTGLNGVFLKQKCIQLMCRKFAIVPCGQSIVGNVCLVDFGRRS